MITEFAAMCRRVGLVVPAWNQARGGNISQKLRLPNGRNGMVIKASGIRLQDVTESFGYATIEVPRTWHAIQDLLAVHSRGDAACDEVIEQRYADILRHGRCPTRTSAAYGLFPSMETGFHVALPRKYVIHFHSLAAICLAAHRKKSASSWDGWIRDVTDLRVSFVEPVRPGFLLTSPVSQCGDSDAIVLANHGVILHSDNANVLESWADFETLVWEKVCLDSCWRNALHPNEKAALVARDLLLEKAAPFSFLFPDMAVFASKVRGVVRPIDNGLYMLKRDAFVSDPDAAELWLAHAALCHLVPTLEPLPAGIVDTVSTLPTEEVRKQIR